MSSYRVADGHDVALESLIALDPQPKGSGIQETRRDYTLGASVSTQGAYTILRYGVLTPAQYNALLSTFGLTSATSNDVTVYIRDTPRSFVRKNGTVFRPDPDWSDLGFWKNIEFYVVELEDAS